jgi:hypothetical protein
MNHSAQKISPARRGASLERSPGYGRSILSLTFHSDAAHCWNGGPVGGASAIYLRPRPSAQTHAAGEKLFVDFAGDTVPVFDGLTGDVRAARQPPVCVGLIVAMPHSAVRRHGLPMSKRAALFGPIIPRVICMKKPAGKSYRGIPMDHIERTKQEFARQAAGFSASAAITDHRLTQRIIEATGAGATSLALDVASGLGSSQWNWLRSRRKSWHSI